VCNTRGYERGGNLPGAEEGRVCVGLSTGDVEMAAGVDESGGGGCGGGGGETVASVAADVMLAMTSYWLVFLMPMEGYACAEQLSLFSLNNKILVGIIIL